jgi:Skp family chaperone for outer membrane proteins
MTQQAQSTQAERIAGLESEFKTIKELLFKMDAKLDAWNSNYVPRREIDEMFRSRDKEIAGLEEDITDGLAALRNELHAYKQEQSSNKVLWPAWVSAIVSLVAVAVAVIALFQN